MLIYQLLRSSVLFNFQPLKIVWQGWVSFLGPLQSIVTQNHRDQGLLSELLITGFISIEKCS